MEIKILEEAGHKLAVTGMMFSFQEECDLKDIEEVSYVDTKRARTLSSRDGGHNKFLESIMVWMDIKAPLKFWKQFDTYRVGVTKQSKSTMHTLMKRVLDSDDFTDTVSPISITVVNEAIKKGDLEKATDNLPDGFLQTRRVCTNYKTIRNMIKQRQFHKLGEWKYFCNYMKKNLKHPRLLGGDIVPD